MQIVVLCLVALIQEATVLDEAASLVEVRGLFAQGKPALALQRIDLSLESGELGERSLWLELRAQALFELADYAGADEQLKALLDRKDVSFDKRYSLEARHANVLSLQDLHSSALDKIEALIVLRDDLAWRRLAVSICLRGREYARLGKHVDEILRRQPNDLGARFARGIARSRQGQFLDALDDLKSGLAIDGAEREARFERALALGKLGRHGDAIEDLWAILMRNPFDQEAAHQLSRRLVRLGGKDRLSAAKHLSSYLAFLRGVSAADSKAAHLEAAGQRGPAALARSARAERLGNYTEAIAELRRAERFAPLDPRVTVGIASFWLRHDFVSETEALLSRAPAEVKNLIESAIAKRRQEIAAESDARLRSARDRIAKTRWDDSDEPLRALLRVGLSLRQAGVMDRAARLALAKNPIAPDSLRYMAHRTESPELILVHAHYLARLVAADPNNLAWSKKLRALRDRFGR